MSSEVQKPDLDKAGSGSEVLLEAASGDLYRKNAFRITELPVDAITRDISRQMEKLKMMEKLGGGVQRAGGALPLDPPPDADAMREAMQHLHNPERRLVDEFFWFWPHRLGESKTDPALLALAKKDIKTASSIWLQQENSQSESLVSKHNLAVLAHAQALDLEYEGKQKALGEEKKKNRDNYWSMAYERWKILIANEGFWSRLTARIRELDDPRLTTGSARRLRNALPLALLRINSQLALHAAENNDIQEAKRHLQIMNMWDSGAPKMDGGKNLSVSWATGSVAAEALKTTIKPLADRIKTHCKTANAECNNADLQGLPATQRLLTQTAPLLQKIDWLLPLDHAMRQSTHDEVAATALSNLISWGNATKKWSEFLEWLNQILPVAASETTRGRIKQNIEIVAGNIKYAKDFGTCYYCKKNPPDGKAHDVPMHGEVNRFGNRVTWKHLTVKVPRCQSCEQAHKQASKAQGIGCVAGMLMGICTCVVVSPKSNDTFGVGITLIGILGLIGLGIASIVAAVKKPKGVKSITDTADFVEIKQLKKQGWKPGAKPSGVQ